MISKVVISLVLTATILTDPSHGFCMPRPGWHVKSLVERIELGEANLVILADVYAINPGPDGPRGPYSADLRVTCIYKDTSGAGTKLPHLLKEVDGFGGLWDCAETKVEAGRSYIILLSREGDRVRVAEVNNQEGAEEAIPSRLSKVERKYSCI